MYVGLCASHDFASVPIVTVLLRFWFCAGSGSVSVPDLVLFLCRFWFCVGSGSGSGSVPVLCRFSDRFILSRTVIYIISLKLF